MTRPITYVLRVAYRSLNEPFRAFRFQSTAQCASRAHSAALRAGMRRAYRLGTGFQAEAVLIKRDATSAAPVWAGHWRNVHCEEAARNAPIEESNA